MVLPKLISRNDKELRGRAERWKVTFPQPWYLHGDAGCPVVRKQEHFQRSMGASDDPYSSSLPRMTRIIWKDISENRSGGMKPGAEETLVPPVRIHTLNNL
ncbi:unnamed protein product [Pleuronectes platessa]|uniref:Uncharacterized protein n=1 Tax=Pleuronectes platessa TaxID=8262 RepID=A0A9N7Y090_PLEPL|nr:unnamed protein product [Pleuronectes platessa]